MTLFLKVARTFLIPSIDELIEASLQADRQNSKRDANLSKNKRTRLGTLLTDIQAIIDTNDETHHQTISALLKAVRLELGELSTAAGYDAGGTEKGIEHLGHFITNFFEKMQALQLTMQPETTLPLYQFNHTVASYLANRALKKAKETGTTSYSAIRLFHNPNITPYTNYLGRLDAIVEGRLGALQRNLAGLRTKDKTSYQQLENEQVQDQLELLELKYDKLYNESEYVLYRQMQAYLPIPEVLPTELSTYIDQAKFAMSSITESMDGDDDETLLVEFK